MPHAQGMPGGGGGLDPILQKYMLQQRQQQFFNTLAQMGQRILAAGLGGADTGPAVAAGLGGGGGRYGGGGYGRSGGGRPLELLRLQGALDQRRERQETLQRARGQHASREALAAPERYDPKTGILWNTPPARPTPMPAGPGVGAGSEAAATPGYPGMTPAQLGELKRRAYPEAAAAAAAREYFPGPAKYGSPQTMMVGGKPTVMRFPQAGGPPQVVAGVQPYAKPGEGPSEVKLANAWVKANKDVGVKVDMREALQWAKTSVGKSPDAIFLSIYNSLVRGFVSSEDAKKTAAEMTEYVVGLRGGAAQPPQGAPAAAMPGSAQGALPPAVAGPPQPRATVSPLGPPPGQVPSLPPAPFLGLDKPAPGRPSGAGVTMPLPPPTPQPTSIETMAADELSALIHGGRELSQDEKDRIWARLDALGVSGR